VGSEKQLLICCCRISTNVLCIFDWLYCVLL